MNKKIQAWAGGALMLIVSVSAMSLGGAIGREGGGVVTRTVLGPTTADVLDGSWSSDSVAGLVLSTPEPFQSHQLRIPPDVAAIMKETVERTESFRTVAGPVAVVVSHVIYRPAVATSLQGAVDGSIARVSAMPGVAEFQSTNREVLISGLRAIRTSSSFLIDGQPTQAGTLSFLSGQELWQVQTVFTAAERASQISDRVLGSVAVAE